VDLERGPLSLESTTDELLQRKSSGYCLENREYGRADPLRWLRYTTLSAKVGTNFVDSRSVGIVRSWNQATELFCAALYWNKVLCKVQQTDTRVHVKSFYAHVNIRVVIFSVQFLWNTFKSYGPTITAHFSRVNKGGKHVLLSVLVATVGEMAFWLYVHVRYWKTIYSDMSSEINENSAGWTVLNWISKLVQAITMYPAHCSASNSRDLYSVLVWTHHFENSCDLLCNISYPSLAKILDLRKRNFTPELNCVIK
jgi:hypothetical protein